MHDRHAIEAAQGGRSQYTPIFLANNEKMRESDS
jgi:hypothetical protein